MNLLAAVYQMEGADEKAVSLRKQLVAVERRRKGQPASGHSLASALWALGDCLITQRKYTEAEVALRESVAEYSQPDPAIFDVFRAEHQLGVALLGQDRFAEAEEHLLTAFTGADAMARRVMPIAKYFLPLVRDDLVRCYDAWGRKDKADRWRSKFPSAEPEKQASPAPPPVK
jgi:tetratricopeptide (TPR) repeat protein